MKNKTVYKIQELIEKYGMPLCDILIKVYAEKQSLALVAGELGVSQSTLSNWILLCGLRIESKLVTYELSAEGQELLKGKK